MRALRVVICVSLSVWKQPPPQALRFSQGRGERLVMNPRDHGKGTRQVWKFESVFLPKMSQFCRLCKLGPGSALGKKAKKKKKWARFARRFHVFISLLFHLVFCLF